MSALPAAQKHAVRERVWQRLQRERVSRFPGARGRIPNFVGAEAAAELLASLDEWQAGRVMKANPDSPQLPVRRRALGEGKVVYMAVPKLREERPFIRLGSEATIKGALREGTPAGLDELGPIDLVVCGSVAVNEVGARVGKGGGYSDLELALLIEDGLVDDGTVIATTVHPLQVLDEPLPEERHDFRVDLIVTPHAVVRTHDRFRPRGIIWDELDREKLAAIPALNARAGRAR